MKTLSTGALSEAALLEDDELPPPHALSARAPKHSMQHASTTETILFFMFSPYITLA